MALRRAEQEKISEARSALQAYWGATGPDRDFVQGRKVLRDLKLNAAEIAQLKDELPLAATGITAERVKACARFLDPLSA